MPPPGTKLASRPAKARGFPARELGGHDADRSRRGDPVADPDLSRSPARALRRPARRPRRHLHPRARQGRPGLVRHLPRDRRRPRLRGRRHARSRSRSSRSRSRSSTAWRSRTAGASAVLRKRSASSRPATRSTRSASSPAPAGRCNPMINAGAIAAVVAGRRATSHEDAARRACSTRSRLYAGRALDDRRGGLRLGARDRPSQPRHRPHAAQLRTSSTSDPEPALDLYFQQCSIPVDCRDLALIGATLANGGVNPVTGERAVRAEFVDADPERDDHVRHVRLRRRVGVPRRHAGEERRRRRHPRGAARPARHRRVLAAARRARQQRARRRGVRDALARSRPALPACAAAVALRRCARATRLPPCARSAADRPTSVRLLDEHGARGRVYELQGDLRFATVERVVREIVDERRRRSTSSCSTSSA